MGANGERCPNDYCHVPCRIYNDIITVQRARVVEGGSRPRRMLPVRHLFALARGLLGFDQVRDAANMYALGDTLVRGLSVGFVIGAGRH